MQTTITTTITTTIDLDTMRPSHAVDVDVADDLPIKLVSAAIVSGCKATIKSVENNETRVSRVVAGDESGG